MNRKVKSFKQCFYRNNKCFEVSTVTSLKHVFECCLSALTQTHYRFCHSIIAPPMIRCSKLAQKFSVHACQVVTVVMVTTQLVLGQLTLFTVVD